MLKTTSNSVKVQFSLGSVFDLLFLLQFLLYFFLGFSQVPCSTCSVYLWLWKHTLTNFTTSNQQFTKLTEIDMQMSYKKKPSLQQLIQLLFLLLYHSLKSSLLHCDCRGCWENYDVFCRRSGVTNRPVRVCWKVPKTGCQVFLSVMLKACQPVVTALHANYKPGKSHTTLNKTTGNNKVKETEAELSLVLMQDCHCTYHSPGWPSPKTFQSAT